MLARCGADMLVVSFLESWRDWWKRRRCGASSCWRVKAFLANLGCSTSDLDRWCSEGEGLWLDNLAHIGVLHLVALACFSSRVRVNVHWVAWRWAPAARARRKGTEAGSVGSRLRAQLSKVEIRSGTVTLGHGLPKLALGPETVEDDAVDDDAEKLNNDLDDAAHKSPVLKTADKCIGDVIFEEMSALVVDTRPAPHVLVVVLRFTLVQYGCSHSPHDDAEDEESNGEDGIVGCHFLGSIMAASEVGNHNDNGHDKRYTGNGEDDDLRPDLGVLGPWWKVVSWCESLCGVEDSEGGCDHGEDNQTASKVDASKEDLGYSDSDLDFQVFRLLLVS